MVKRILGWLAVAVLQAVLVPVPAAAGTINYILRSPSAMQAQGVCDRYGLTMVKNLDKPDIFLVQGSDTVPFDMLKSWMKDDPDIKNFEIDKKGKVPESSQAVGMYSTAAAPLSTYVTDKKLTALYGTQAWVGYVQQTAMTLINGSSQGGKDGGTGSATGNGVIVAVIDTGVDQYNPNLAPVLVPGFDFTRNLAGYASDVADLEQSTAAILEQSTAAILEQKLVVQLNQSTAAILEQSTATNLATRTLPSFLGHGTMVAGLIHLVAPGAKIMPLKAFAADGSSNESDIIRAIYFATDNGAKVINMSFEISAFSDELMRAINYADRHGVICVASVGNEAQRTLVYPAALGNVIGVGSSSASNAASAFTNLGPDMVSIAAPGEGLVTTYLGNHYASVSGTSFSSALVSGGVAVLIDATSGSVTFQMTSSDARRALNQANAACSPTGDLGAGCMDLNKAVSYISSMQLPSTSATPKK